MSGDLIGGLIGCLVLVACGLLCVVLGRKGRAGQIDYQWGGITKGDVTPAAWRKAHVEAGRMMELSGWWFVIGGFASAVLLPSAGEGVTAAAVVGACLIATVLVLVGVFRGLRILNGR